jgi:hypothetical protein
MFLGDLMLQRPCLLQPVSVPRAQLDRTVLQQDQAMSPCRDPIDKLAANYLAFIKLASIRIWLRANESAPFKITMTSHGREKSRP